MRRRSEWKWLVVCAVLAIGSAASARAGGSLIDDLVSMLEGGISPAVVTSWLGDQEDTIDSVEAEDLLRLEKAGATDEILELVLEMGRRDGPHREDVVPSPRGETLHPDSPSAALEEATAQGTAPSADPAQGAASSSIEPETTGPVRTSFRATYTPNDDLDRTEEWHLYLYIDGWPASWIPGGALQKTASGIEFEVDLDPGQHVLQVVQEIHEPGHRRIRHAARVPPAEARLVFTLEPGEPADVEVDVGAGLLRAIGSRVVAIDVYQGDRRASAGTTAEPDDWRPVCEEIEPNRDDDGRLPADLRDDERRCVAWADVWPENDPPTRSEIREAMAAYDFRPIQEGARGL